MTYSDEHISRMKRIIANQPDADLLYNLQTFEKRMTDGDHSEGLLLSFSLVKEELDSRGGNEWQD